MWFNKQNSSSQEGERAAWSPEKPLFGALLDLIDHGIIVYDKDFNIRYFNKGAEDIFGFKIGNIVGQQLSLEKTKDPAFKILASVIYSSLAPIAIKLSEAGAFPQVVKIILDDPALELETYTNQILDDQSQVWGFLKVIKDKTRESTLLKAKNEFITAAAHQLRTPTTAINWTFENLEKDQTISSDSQESINVGHKAAQNLLKIVTDLLSVAQLEEGKFDYQFTNVNLVDFLDKLLAEAAPIAKQYKVNVYFERPEEKELWVSADPGRLGLAISNLVDNAIKYNTAEGQVVVKLIKQDGIVQMSVRDTGVGIPEEDLPRLFTKFFRAKNTAKFSVAGSGLGLYLVKNIITEHNGKIWVESVMNRGSTFYFTLPLKS